VQALLAVLILSDALDGPMYALFGLGAVALPAAGIAAAAGIRSRWPSPSCSAIGRRLRRTPAAWLLWLRCAGVRLGSGPSSPSDARLAAALLGTSVFGRLRRVSPAAQSPLVAAAVSATAATAALTAIVCRCGASTAARTGAACTEKNLLGRVMALRWSAPQFRLENAGHGLVRSLCAGVLLDPARIADCRRRLGRRLVPLLAARARAARR
jgi:hypothetical protein